MSTIVRGFLGMLVVGIVAPLALLDCGGATVSSANPDGGACPVSAPTEGAACAVEGTMCSGYSTGQISNCICCNGGGTSWVCEVGGKWTELESASPGGGGPVAPEACPATIPVQGSTCATSACTPVRAECNYDCVTGKGTSGVASCMHGSWNVTVSKDACIVDSGIDAWATAPDAALDAPGD